MNKALSFQQPRIRRTVLATCLGAALGVLGAHADTTSATTPAAATDARLMREAMLASTIVRDPRVEAYRAQHPSRPPRPDGAATHVVTNCNDDGPGSLRNAFDVAASGDTIDMTSLACSTITLTTGSLATTLTDIDVVGPGSLYLTLTSERNSAIFTHLGTGELNISGVALIDGAKYTTTGDANGGCVYSLGNVRMEDVRAKYCIAASVDGDARGGAVYAAEGISLHDSVISGNEVSSTNGVGIGGGLFTPESLGTKYATIQNNDASTGAGGASIGGNLTFKYSTASSNEAPIVAGLDNWAGNATTINIVRNSTIANNHSSASSFGAGLYLGADSTISNSTISGNIEENAATTKYGAGISIPDGVDITMTSTIVSGNVLRDTSGGGATDFPSDIGLSGFGSASFVVAGSHNLIGRAGDNEVPADTIVEVDPMLGNLAYNGGPTWTMLPLPGSPAIDAGSGSIEWDQRGDGYPRLVGGGVDIGAVEASDVIFADGFD